MYDALFNPLQLAGVSVPNRIARSAHLLSLSLDDLIAYTRVRAAGGVGLSVIGAAGVHSTSARLPVVAATDAIIPWYEQLVEACSPYDMRLFQQINHFGAAMPSAPGIQNWSSGPVPNPTVSLVPRTLTKDMIDEIVGSYGAAAGRVKRGGMQGVELNGAHGYLIAQFLSTALNFRDDEYGGSLENRLRFVNEVIDAVRAEVGPEFPLGLRLVADDVLPGGIGPDGYAEIAKLLQHKVDYISVSLGTYWKFSKIFSTMESPLGYEMPTSEVVTRALDIPTMVTGRIMTLDHANHIVESGAADMVSMVRATIADPEIVNKSRAGNAHRVRPCTGTSIGCTGGSATGNFGCVVNATAGQESRMSLEPEAAPVKKKVLIVGGGPAEARLKRELPNARFVGYQSGTELGRYVASFDIFVHTGKHETFCQAIQEALAAGVPVIGPDTGGPVDLIEHGITGLLIDTSDSYALLEAVSTLRTHSAFDLMQIAARRSVEHRTWDYINAQLIDYYRQTIAHVSRKGELVA